MFIKLSKKTRLGFTLAEALVASGLFGIVSAALCSVYLFSTKSFASLANYAELDQINRNAMDYVTREIRQAKEVVNVTTNSAGMIITIALVNADGYSVNYNFDSTTGKLMRFANDGSAGKVLLENCHLLQFDVRQRTAQNGTFDEYPLITSADSIQVIRLTWQASRTVPGGSGIVNSENIQTARVVIRNQHKFGN